MKSDEGLVSIGVLGSAHLTLILIILLIFAIPLPRLDHSINIHYGMESVLLFEGCTTRY
jgi:hypothetical protein